MSVKVAITIPKDREDMAVAALKATTAARNFAIATKGDTYEREGRVVRYNELSAQWTASNPYRGQVARVVMSRALFSLDKEWATVASSRRTSKPLDFPLPTDKPLPASFGPVAHDETHIYLPLIGAVPYVGQIPGRIENLKLYWEGDEWFADLTVAEESKDDATQTAESPLADPIEIPADLLFAATDAVAKRRIEQSALDEARHSADGLVRLALALLSVFAPLRNRITTEEKFKPWLRAVQQAEAIIGTNNESGVVLAFKEIQNAVN
jgi:hypothetical protein